MKKLLPPLIALSALSMPTAGALAHPIEFPEPDIKRLDPIKVEVTPFERGLMNTSSSVYEVKNNPLTQLNSAIDPSSILNGIPGLQVNDRQNYAQDLQVSIRGFGARSTYGVRGLKIFVDGIPSSMPDGQGQTSNIDLNSLDSIQVLTGPYSSIYGNAAGGTILASTRAGQGDPSVAAAYTAGSYTKQQGNLTIQSGSDVGSLLPAYYLSTSYLDNGGFRDNSTTYKNLNNAKLSWTFNDGSELHWVLNDVHINAQDPGGLTSEDVETNRRGQHAGLEQYRMRKFIDQTQSGMNLHKTLGDSNEVDIKGYYGRRHVTQYLSIPEKAQQRLSHSGGVVEFARHYQGADLHWQNRELLPDTQTILGLSYDRMKDSRRGYENFEKMGDYTHYGVKGNLRRDESNTVWNLDPYAAATWSFLPGWYLDGGVRFSNTRFSTKDYFVAPGNPDDSGQFDYQRWLPSLGLGWQATDNLYTYASYGKGFETPTITELAYSPIEGDSGFNKNLEASLSDNYEVGLKSSNAFGDFTAAIYYILTHKDIVPGLVVDGRGTFRNADKTVRKGVDLGWTKNIWEHLSLKTTYSLIDARFSKDIPAAGNTPAVTKGNRIPGIARHELYSELGWKPQDGWQAQLNLNVKDKIYVNDQNQDRAAGYGVVGASVGYAKVVDGWTINAYARVDNLLNKEYIGSVIVNDGNGRFFEPAPKRNVNVGIRVMKMF